MTLEDGVDRLSEASVRNYGHTLRNIPEVRGSQASILLTAVTQSHTRERDELRDSLVMPT
jgi:hypothetical protein